MRNLILHSCLSWFFCLVPLSPALSADWAISGTVLGPNGIIIDGAVAVAGSTLSYVGQASSVPNALTLIETNAIVIPGFIDLHNHLTWNILPRWIPNHKFGNRYDWQDTAEYDRVLVAPHMAAMSAVGCEAEIYAEIKALIGGATSVVGSSSNKACAAGLVRNLDVASGLGFVAPGPGDPCEPKPPKPPQSLLDFVANEVFPLEIPYERLVFLKCELEAGTLRSLVVHLSEGAPTDASAHREFNMLKSAGLLMPGLAIVHGTALQPKDFADMATAHVGLVWSPRSNDELYGATTNVAAAQQASVTIAIAPDWSPSGSAGMLQEMGYIARRYKAFSAQQIVSMATSAPAKLSRLDNQLGSLEPGKAADLVVIRGDASKPFDSIVQATPADIVLVVVGGMPLYGDQQLLAALIPAAKLEAVAVCGTTKMISLEGSGATPLNETLQDLQNKLNAALRRAGSRLAELECQ
jgi:cytosine/adenosine deaminase-related metal-dependent hydrolase